MITINSKIVRGKGRGKSILGYATANSLIKGKNECQELAGKEGAWYVLVHTRYQKEVKGVCGVSIKNNEFVLETHLLDFDSDIYDQEVAIVFNYKIREQIIFKSLDESRVQLEKDIDFVRRYRSCYECKFCVYRDYGYSNYTVEGTEISCLVNKFEPYEDSYYGNDTLGIATDCDYYNKGESWNLDVDGDIERPTDEWVKSESILFTRDIKIKNILGD